MPEDNSPPHDPSSESRPLSKHRWRGKLFSPEGKFGRNIGDLESTDDDVANFLHPGASRSKARPLPTELAPRIDVDAARRSPSPVQPPASSSVVDFYRGPKPRQNKGLRVNFSTATPEVIGEGGEEAELPPAEVKKLASYRTPQRKPLPDGLYPGANDELARGSPGSSPVLVGDGTFQPVPLQRRPTGLSDISDDDSLDDRDHDPEMSSLVSSASPLPESKPLPRLPYQVQKLREFSPETGLEDIDPHRSPLTDKIFEFNQDRPSQISESTGYTESKSLPVPSTETVAGNSVTPSPSTQPSNGNHGVSSSSYGFPPTAPSIHTTSESPDPKYTAKTQAIPDPTKVSQSKPLTLRQVAKGLGEDSLDDFDSRVRRFNDIFRLGVSAHVDMMSVPFAQWIRTACWWFLKGRQGLEGEVRNKSSTTPHADSSPVMKQAYVNLAKAWWIVKDITPNHPEMTRFGKASMNSLCAMIKSFGNQVLAEQAEVHVDLIANMRALTMSMKRNGKLPPSNLEIQRLDLPVLLELPRLSLDTAGPMVNNTLGAHNKGWPHILEPIFPFPIGDTNRHFNFGRMFVELKVPDSASQDIYLPCVVSVLRDRSEWGVRILIASQDAQVNFVISDEMTNALSWKTVRWKIQSQEMAITVSQNLNIQVKLSEKDFKTLWGICDYTTTIRKGFSAQKDETVVFERVLQSFQCNDAAHFPSDSVSDCRLRVFEKEGPASEPNSRHRSHNGFRLAVITPPTIKSLSTVNYDLAREHPLLFGIHRGTEGSRLVLRVLPSAVMLSPTFVKADDLDAFRHILSGTTTSKEDYRFPPLDLQSLTIDRNLVDGDSQSLRDSPTNVYLPWTKLRVIKKGSLPHSQEIPSTTSSENLRILADSELGTLTDRISLALDDIQVNLSIDNLNEIKVLRPPQSDMTWSLADERISKDEIKSVSMMLKIMLTFTTIRTYCFRSLKDLHNFHAMVTGFSIMFDGPVNSFAISRRRSGLPVHKKWETNSARLQIVKRDKTVQLVGFFKDFSHGSCINFALKITDVFETFSKGGLFFLRIVDAKFAMPKGPEDPSRDFVCLEMPEYPCEHDDVTIGFDNEHDRDLFGSVLPTHVNKISKMASLRR